MTRSVWVWAMAAVGCASACGATVTTTRHENSAGIPARNQRARRSGVTATTAGLSGDASALEQLRARMAAGDARALSAAHVVLDAASGAREMTGDEAVDDRVSSATLVTRVGDSAALLVITVCGNATLASVRWEASRWIAGERVELVGDMRPGRCGQTTVRAESLPLASDVRSEIAAVVTAQDATGESLRGPFLSVFQLQTHGALRVLLADAPFGAMDDVTGATTTGNYLVVEDVPAPRDLYVAIRPGRPGPGGAPVNEIVRRRYAIRGARLEMIQQTSEAAE